MTYPLQWLIRRSLWDALALAKFRVNKPVRIPAPTAMEAPLESVPLQEVFPSIRLSVAPSSRTVPPDEAKTFNRRSYDVQMWLAGAFGANMKGLPEVPADPQARLAEAYRPSKRAVFPAPQLPPEYAGEEPDLGALALAGPYQSYLQADGPGRWVWDFTVLGAFEHRPELHNLGSKVTFRWDGRALKPVSIDCELGTVSPGDATWAKARDIALCALTTHCGLIRHFNGIHLAFGGPTALAARNALPADHPVLRLLWPHIFGTQYSNELATYSQMDPNGDFPNVYAFTPKGMYDLFDATWPTLRFADYDPVAYDETSGLRAAGAPAPGADNLIAIHNVFEQHARRYLRLYYPSDAALAADAAVTGFLGAVDRAIPGGLPDWARPVAIDAFARFFAVLVDIVVVEHELRGTFLWNYQLWTHAHPIRVYRDGRREPVDVYQRLVNCNMTLNVNRASLFQDFSYLALDERGAGAFRDFLGALKALQASMADNPRLLWKLYPDMLNANMNA